MRILFITATRLGDAVPSTGLPWLIPAWRPAIQHAGKQPSVGAALHAAVELLEP
jgi:hypothetical protein